MLDTGNQAQHILLGEILLVPLAIITMVARLLF